MENYSDFFDLLTGYRRSLLLMLAAELGICELIGEGIEEEELLSLLEGNKTTCRRLISAFIEMGLLRKENHKLRLTAFSEKFLHPSSPSSQLQTVKLERKIMEKWLNLPAFTEKGEHENLHIKGRAEYIDDLTTFLHSMDEAADIRSCELWDAISGIPEKGTIVDFGAGSGSYLRSFLDKYPQWQGVFCDLDDVVKISEKRDSMHNFNSRIAYYSLNLLDDIDLPEKFPEADLILYSNFLHCQSFSENKHIMSRSLKCLKAGSKVVIHDFIPGLSPNGSLYDIHMMLNTWNGRAWSLNELEKLLMENCLNITGKKVLPSGSALIEAVKPAISS